MEGSLSPRSNKLIAQLPAEVYDAMRPQLQLIHYPSGKILFENGTPCEYVYFPVSGVIARVLANRDDEEAELSLCGREGAVGISLLLGGAAIATALVLLEARVYRCRCDHVVRQFAAQGFRAVVRRYARTVVGEIAQNALCYKHHELDGQFARWLLTCLDRSGSAELRVTHALVSRMLGVRREGVTEAAGRLQSAGAISSSRGMIRVLDRGILLQRACSCYRVLESERLQSPSEADVRLLQNL